jgi:hypothetical protein
MKKPHHLKSFILNLIMVAALISAIGCEKKDDKAKNALNHTASGDTVAASKYSNDGNKIKDTADNVVVEYNSEDEKAVQVNNWEELKDSVERFCENTFVSRMKGDPKERYGEVDNSDIPLFSVMLLPIFGPDTLIKQLESLDENTKHGCRDEHGEIDYKICVIGTNTLCLEYMDKGNGERYVSYFRTEDKNVPMLNGKLKVGMTWEEFLNATGLDKEFPDIEFIESGYITIILEASEINFYFDKGILQEVGTFSTV